MWVRLGELSAVFFRLGALGFGGPAVHIALLEDEVVRRRGWMTRGQLLDLMGATNLIPGPNSTEMAMYVGYLRAGYLGLVVAGMAFILPAAVATTLIAWLYVIYGRADFMQPVLAGIQPAVLALILTALWRLGRQAVADWRLLAIFLAAAAMMLAGGGPIFTVIVVSAAGVGWLWLTRDRRRHSDPHGSGSSSGRSGPAALVGGAAALAFSGSAGKARAGAVVLAAAASASPAVAAAAPPSLWTLGIFFLKVGAVLYGSGYVLLAYIEGGLVQQLGWLTPEELLEAAAVGNFTPGPVLSTATFIGYLVMARDGGVWGGLQGAAVATTAVFLPSFLFVALLGPMLPRLRECRLAATFLDAVNAVSIGLMAAVAVRFCSEVFLYSAAEGRTAIHWPSVAIALGGAWCMLRWRLHPVWLVLGGAAAGSLLASVPFVANT